MKHLEELLQTTNLRSLKFESVEQKIDGRSFSIDFKSSKLFGRNKMIPYTFLDLFTDPYKSYLYRLFASDSNKNLFDLEAIELNSELKERINCKLDFEIVDPRYKNIIDYNNGNETLFYLYGMDSKIDNGNEIIEIINQYLNSTNKGNFKVLRCENILPNLKTNDRQFKTDILNFYREGQRVKEFNKVCKDLGINNYSKSNSIEGLVFKFEGLPEKFKFVNPTFRKTIMAKKENKNSDVREVIFHKTMDKIDKFINKKKEFYLDRLNRTFSTMSSSSYQDYFHTKNLNLIFIKMFNLFYKSFKRDVQENDPKFWGKIEEIVKNSERYSYYISFDLESDDILFLLLLNHYSIHHKRYKHDLPQGQIIDFFKDYIDMIKGSLK